MCMSEGKYATSTTAISVMMRLSLPLPEDKGLKPKSSSSRRRRLIALYIAALLLVSVAIVEYDSYSLSAAASSSSSTQSMNSEAIAENLQFVAVLENQSATSVSGVLKFYTNSSVVSWGGNITSQSTPFDRQGTYAGLAEISGLYSKAMDCFYEPNIAAPHSSDFSVSASNLTATAVGPNKDNATFDLFIFGWCFQFEDYGASAYVKQEWTDNNGTWTIARENWDFLETSAQSTLPGGGPAGAG
jgi:hypothetical protein